MNTIFEQIYEALCELYGEKNVSFNRGVNEIHIKGTIEYPSVAIMQADDDPETVIGYHNDVLAYIVLTNFFKKGVKVGKTEYHYSCPRE